MCGIDGTLFPTKAGTTLWFEFIGTQFPKVALTGNLGLEGTTPLVLKICEPQRGCTLQPRVARQGYPGNSGPNGFEPQRGFAEILDLRRLRDHENLRKRQIG